MDVSPLAANAAIAAIASEGCLYVLSGLVGFTLSSIPSNSATFEMLIRLEGSINPFGVVKSGSGLHGEDFAYVKAVRQLAEEENCPATYAAVKYAPYLL